MFERFTDRARKVMVLANQEAQRLNHEYIGTEHILLGLVKEGGGIAAAALRQLNVDLPKVRVEIEKFIKSGPDPVAGGKLPQTPRAKKVVKYAIKEARKLGHNYVGTEHLLLGLIGERDGVAARALINLGLELDHVRREVMELIAKPSDNVDRPDIRETADALTKRADHIMRQAIEQRASDVHFDPQQDGPCRVRYRIDGVLHDREPIPHAMTGAAILRIKAMAGMNDTQVEIPQDGRIRLNIDSKTYDLRVCSVPVLHGERIVMRILHPEQAFVDLTRIFTDDDLKTVRTICQQPNGIVIFTGPMGSGKTTTLYSMLADLDRDHRCVMSIEDPVEYDIPGVAQIQVHPQSGLTFARALRSILRQDPDVVMVGEIRDLEVLRVCAQTALTGHLVLTTLHADTTPGAIKRLIDIGLEPFLVNSTIVGVIAQRLLRKLCPECRQPGEPAEHSLPPQAVEYVRRAKDTTFYVPKGCPACLETGYRSRIAMHEILIPDERFRQAVSASADLATLRNAAIAAGMKPMIINGLEKAAQGITSIEEVCRIAPHGPND